MFSGIVETRGKIVEVVYSKTNIEIWLSVDFIDEIKIDQSIAHNGICLTVDALESNRYRVTAIGETIAKTTISQWKNGDSINIERCVKLGDRMDGHIVQGHIDTLGECIEKMDKNGSWDFRFSYPNNFLALLIEKGSITIDGISLTCYNLVDNTFAVSIIPYTFDHTIAQHWQVGTKVNLEFDLLGKYIQRSLVIA